MFYQPKLFNVRFWSILGESPLTWIGWSGCEWKLGCLSILIWGCIMTGERILYYDWARIQAGTFWQDVPPKKWVWVQTISVTPRRPTFSSLYTISTKLRTLWLATATWIIFNLMLKANIAQCKMRLVHHIILSKYKVASSKDPWGNANDPTVVV